MARILIVDDSKVVLSLHSYIIENAGHEPITADNGYEALELLLTHDIDLVVSDVNMPRMDGYELTRKIREQGDFESLPIIIISTEAEAQDKTRGLKAGANIYVVKPTDPQALVMNVEMLLQ